MSNQTPPPSGKNQAPIPTPPNMESKKEQPQFSPQLMVNLTLTISWVLILVVGVAVTLISYFSGSTGLDLILRAGSAVLIASLVLWFLSTTVIKGSRDLVKKLQEEEKEALEAQSKSSIRDVQA